VKHGLDPSICDRHHLGTFTLARLGCQAGWTCMTGRGSGEEKKTSGFFTERKVTSTDVCFWEYLLSEMGLW
jgi:hypothetical protein